MTNFKFVENLLYKDDFSEVHWNLGFLPAFSSDCSEAYQAGLRILHFQGWGTQCFHYLQLPRQSTRMLWLQQTVSCDRKTVTWNNSTMKRLSFCGGFQTFGVSFLRMKWKFKKKAGHPLSDSFASIHTELVSYLTTHESQVNPESSLLLLSEEDDNTSHGSFFTGTHRHHLN